MAQHWEIWTKQTKQKNPQTACYIDFNILHSQQLHYREGVGKDNEHELCEQMQQERT